MEKPREVAMPESTLPKSLTAADAARASLKYAGVGMPEEYSSNSLPDTPAKWINRTE